MKTLKEFLTEGILDIEDNIENLSVESLIKDFIRENYDVGKIPQIKKKADKYIVSTNGYVLVKNKNITTLTNGLFEWGEVNSFYCSNCTLLKDLTGAPKKVGTNFNCNECTSLESLEGAPKEVGANFDCGNCTSLKSLEGAPEEVGVGFSCDGCTSLKDLIGAPEKVGSFYCNGCTSLKSLKGAPKEVGEYFSCSGCTSLESLKGAPKKVRKIFNCADCGKKFTEEDVEKVCNVTSRVIYV